MRANLYSDVHKGLRRELATLLLDCGSCDPEATGEIARLCDRLHLLQSLLEAHAGHEEKWLEPVLRAHGSALAGELAGEHVLLHEKLAALDSVFSAWRRAPAGERAGAAAEAYGALATFVAKYLTHMGREENESMPAIQAALSDADIHALAGQLRASIPPPQMAQFLGLMLPAMNVLERVQLFAGMKAQAPREMLEKVSELASRVLSAEDWAAVRVRAEL